MSNSGKDTEKAKLAKLREALEVGAKQLRRGEGVPFDVDEIVELGRKRRARSQQGSGRLAQHLNRRLILKFLRNIQRRHSRARHHRLIDSFVQQQLNHFAPRAGGCLV